jgi:hypothetical protein
METDCFLFGPSEMLWSGQFEATTSVKLCKGSWEEMAIQFSWESAVEFRSCQSRVQLSSGVVSRVQELPVQSSVESWQSSSGVASPEFSWESAVEFRVASPEFSWELTVEFRSCQSRVQLRSGSRVQELPVQTSVENRQSSSGVASPEFSWESAVEFRSCQYRLQLRIGSRVQELSVQSSVESWQAVVYWNLEGRSWARELKNLHC